MEVTTPRSGRSGLSSVTNYVRASLQKLVSTAADQAVEPGSALLDWRTKAAAPERLQPDRSAM